MLTSEKVSFIFWSLFLRHSWPKRLPKRIFPLFSLTHFHTLNAHTNTAHTCMQQRTQQQRFFCDVAKLSSSSSQKPTHLSTQQQQLPTHLWLIKVAFIISLFCFWINRWKDKKGKLLRHAIFQNKVHKIKAMSNCSLSEASRVLRNSRKEQKPQTILITGCNR